MKQQYWDWISANVTEEVGTCAETTQDMLAVFPELRRVRGHYYCPVWGEREHWWLVDPDGDIVDPTASQFPSRGTGTYVAWIEGQPEPTGMCPNCGEYVYDGNTVCSDVCGYAYASFCLNGY